MTYISYSCVHLNALEYFFLFFGSAKKNPKFIRAGSLITAVFYCSNNDILNKYLRYGCVHMQMAVYAGHYSGHYSENYSKQF
jgi:hypothetical protein